MRACIAASVAVVIFVLSPIQAHGQGMGLPARVQALEAAVAALQTTVAALTAKLSSVTVESGEINGVAGPNLIFTGVNVHIRSGSGATNDGGTPTGLGNLIVGYNEEPIDGLLPGDRGGAHTLVIGPQHKFLNVGGLVAGFRNTVSDEAASVSGGDDNTASGRFSSVSGGAANTASGPSSSVSGGIANTASGTSSSVSGGVSNTASGLFSTVSGGQNNTASAFFSTVSGGVSLSTSFFGQHVP